MDIALGHPPNFLIPHAKFELGDDISLLGQWSPR
jgi:hypothetical protein